MVGFENHGGQTVGVDHPLGKVLYGCGNSFDAGWEGFYDGKVLGTYLHGPLLPKNPKIADFVITKALQKKDPGFQMSDLRRWMTLWKTVRGKHCLRDLKSRGTSSVLWEHLKTVPKWEENLQ